MNGSERLELTNTTGRGDTRVVISAFIDGDGAVVLEGHDWGPSVKELWGRTEYDYWVSVPESAKDQLLLLLLKERYQGDTEAVTRFKDWAVTHDLPASFDNWLGGE